MWRNWDTYLLHASWLFHWNAVYPPCELLGFLRENLLQVSREDDLSIVLITELVKSEGNLSLCRQIECINLELWTNSTFDGSTNMEGKRDTDLVATGLIGFLDSWVLWVSHQIWCSLHLSQSFDRRDESFISNLLSHESNILFSRTLWNSCLGSQLLLLFLKFAPAHRLIFGARLWCATYFWLIREQGCALTYFARLLSNWDIIRIQWSIQGIKFRI